jgi:hypothetical protein
VRQAANRDCSASRLARQGENIMSIKFINNIGFLLLAIWLILTGLATFISALAALGPILAILAIVAGIFIIIGR